MEFREQETGFLDSFRYCFTGHRLDMIIESILAVKAKARFFTLQGSETNLFLLWDQGNSVLYLAGGDSSPGACSALKKLINSTIREWTLSHKQGYFCLKGISGAVSPHLQEAFGHYITGEHEKAFYRYPRSLFLPSSNPGGVEFFVIDEEFLYRRGLTNLKPIRDEIGGMWPSIESYLAGGFGIAAVAGNSAVCWCTAEYVGPNFCGIGIKTVEEMQNRGIATAAAARFIALSMEKGLRPHWECWTGNRPSVRLAEKLNFKHLETHLLPVGQFV